MAASASASSAPRRIAVVGAGYFCQFHLDGWAGIPGVEVVALCDLDLRKAGVLARRFGVPRVYDNVAAMLDDASAELVDIVTPPVNHAAVLDTLYTRGLPVICQKPFGTSYAQAQTFAIAAKECGIELIVHENFRFMPWYRELRRLIDEGFFGQMYGVTFRLRPGDGQGLGAYLDRQPYFQTMPRLLVAETAIHFIDTFRYLMGEVIAVYARLRRLNPVIQGEDAALITFEFNGGAVGLFDGNRLNDHQAVNARRTMGEMWIEGSLGVMRLDGDGKLWWKPHHQDEREHFYERGPDGGFGGGACAALQKHVLSALAGQGQLENTAHDYLRNLLIQEAVYASHATGRRIVISDFIASTSDVRPALALQPSLPFTHPQESL